MNQERTMIGNGINVNFLSTLNVLRDNNWIIRRDTAGSSELLCEIFFVVNDSHGGTRKHVTGTNKNRISNRFGKFFGVFDRSEFLPSRLVDTNFIQNL